MDLLKILKGKTFNLIGYKKGTNKTQRQNTVIPVFWVYGEVSLAAAGGQQLPDGGEGEGSRPMGAAPLIFSVLYHQPKCGVEPDNVQYAGQKVSVGPDQDHLVRGEHDRQHQHQHSGQHPQEVHGNTQPAECFTKFKLHLIMVY